ncbi:MAG: hypothetical protein OEY91_08955 [Nitrospirota bacterium]|nr:hypothetical protein [Nitrospirota bacterium]
MRYLKKFSSSPSCRLCYLLCLLVWSAGTIAGAENSPSPPPPMVFQPGETQHGFAEFDTPPDFFEDETPAPYDSYSHSPSLPAFDQKPAGLFHALAFAEDVEEDRTIRRGHIQVPINPTDTFPASSKAVYLVFSVHKHYAPYQIIGRLFSETPEAAKPDEWIDEDIADLALEDESGYLKFFPPDGVWAPGLYRVDIYVGYIVNTANKMGAMRFTVRAETLSQTESPEPVSPNP